MVHHHDVRLHRLGARLEYEAFLVVGAFLSQATVARGSHLHPDRRILRHVRQPALVARVADLGVLLDPAQMLDVFARLEHAVRFGARQMVVAQVVRASLEQRHRNRRLQRIAHHRQVFLEQLVLQVLGAGRDDHLAAREQRGNQVGKSLAGTRACLDDQDRVVAYRLGNFQSHFALLRARTERRDFRGKRALFGKKTFDFEGHGRVIRYSGESLLLSANVEYIVIPAKVGIQFDEMTGFPLSRERQNQACSTFV